MHRPAPLDAGREPPAEPVVAGGGFGGLEVGGVGLQVVAHAGRVMTVPEGVDAIDDRAWDARPQAGPATDAYRGEVAFNRLLIPG